MFGKHTMEDLTDQIILSSSLGRGTSFEVYAGWLKDGEKLTRVAVKFSNNNDENTLKDEFRQHKRFSAVTKYVPRPLRSGVFGTPPKPVTVSEICEGETLYRLFTEKKMSCEKSLRLILEIINEFHRLSNRGLCHGDPHLNNVVVRQKDLKWSLIDFDMANDQRAFYSLGKQVEHLDTSIFLTSIYFHASFFRNKKFSALIKKLLRKHIRKMRLFMHRVKISSWLDETPCIFNGHDYTYKTVDDRGYVRFNETDVKALQKEVIAKVSHPHAAYYFGHVFMPQFDTTVVEKALEKMKRNKTQIAELCV